MYYLKKDGSVFGVQGTAGSGLVLFLLVIALCVGCDDLVDVEAPARLPAEDFEAPQNAQTLVDGAIGDFECALSHYVVAGGLMGNELAETSQTVHLIDYDRRTFNDQFYGGATCDNIFTQNNLGQAVGVYAPLSIARWQADNVLELLRGWTNQQVENRRALIATAAAYSGYSHVLMGEAMCSAAFDEGPEVPREEIFNRAVTRFNTAIESAQESESSEILNMARVGLARTLLNLDDLDGARSVAENVEEGFEKNASYSSTALRRENQLFVKNIREQAVSISPFGIFRDATFKGETDPRVPVTNTGTPGADGTRELWTQDKVTAAGDPIPIATWEEAQLIIAEAEVQENPQVAVDIINKLHDRVGLPNFSSDDSGEIMEQIIYERKVELFLESHHLGDLLRYNLGSNPTAGESHPGGGSYQELQCFPIPSQEVLNNPNI